MTDRGADLPKFPMLHTRSTILPSNFDDNNNDNNNKFPSYRYSRWCQPLSGPETAIDEDGILVMCNISRVVVYKNVHYFIQRDRVMRASGPHSITEGANYNQSTVNVTGLFMADDGKDDSLQAEDIITVVEVVERGKKNECDATMDNEQEISVAKNRNGDNELTINNEAEQKHNKSDPSTRSENITDDEPGGQKSRIDIHEAQKDDRSPSEDAATKMSQSNDDTKSTEDTLRVDGAEHLSVIIFGTDSASRLNMRRHLPQTYRYLTGTLGAVDLTGFNKVGDNTFPNLIPILSGLSTQELAKHPCVPKKETFDRCNWIWKDFKRNGYVTAYIEVCLGV